MDVEAASAPQAPTPQEEPQVQPNFQFLSIPPLATIAQPDLNMLDSINHHRTLLVEV